MSSLRTTLQEKLECPICNEPFSSSPEASPHHLGCGHVMLCFKCITENQRAKGLAQNQAECPNCGQRTEFSKNLFFLNIVEEVSKPPAVWCADHEENLTAYCLQCEVALCLSCVEASHKSHNWTLMKKAMAVKKALVQQRKDEISARVNALLRVKAENKSQLDNLQSEQKQFSHVITNSRDKVVEAVNKQAALLLQRLGSFFSDKEQRIQNSERQCDAQLKKLNQLQSLGESGDPVSALASWSQNWAALQSAVPERLVSVEGAAHKVLCAVDAAEILKQIENWRCEFEPAVRPAQIPKANWRDFAIGDIIDAQDSQNNWYMSSIREVTRDKVFVHFINWTSKWDEWIDRYSPRLARANTYTTGPYQPPPGQTISSPAEPIASQNARPPFNPLR